MQNDGKAGPGHKASTELALHSPLTRLPVILLQVHDKAVQHLRLKLQALFDNADETLFEMADKARDDAEQSLFFQAMRDVRLKRKNIERGFLERLSDGFIKLTQPDTSDTTLQGGGGVPSVFSLLVNDFERVQVINTMVGKVLVRDQLALCHLTTRLNALSWIVLDEGSNPLGPAMMCEYFLQAEREQGVNLKVKLILLQLFGKYLLSQTGQLYADANQLLIATGVLPDLSIKTSCCSFKRLDDTYATPASDEDACRLVALLFEYIDTDRNLSLPLKQLIGQLQGPMHRIAQLDQNFFSCDSHPARRLLNVIAGAAIGLDASVEARLDPLYRQVEHVVQQLTRYSGNNPGVLESLLHDFLMFTHMERDRIERLEQRTRDETPVFQSRRQQPLSEPDHLGLLLVSQLRVGMWIELQDDRATRLRCKLIKVVESEGRYVFVNRSGVKVVEKSRGDLIGQLRNGTILLLDDRLLFDRALASVIGSLGSSSAH